MDDDARAARARSLFGDDVFKLALSETLGSINKGLLAATTPEDREQRWQEYHGLKRAVNLLEMWATHKSQK